MGLVPSFTNAHVACLSHVLYGLSVSLIESWLLIGLCGLVVSYAMYVMVMDSALTIKVVSVFVAFLVLVHRIPFICTCN